MYLLRREWNSFPLSIRRIDDNDIFQFAVKRHYNNENRVESYYDSRLDIKMAKSYTLKINYYICAYFVPF